MQKERTTLSEQEIFDMTMNDSENQKLDIVVFDDMPPEATAMILALYSRDPQSVRIHRERVVRVGAEKFMSQYYVGYGHKSIGDCGSTTICAEYVSMLAAKAIQHNPLYNGQEASTRYLDMTEMPVLNPLGTSEGEEIQKTWMTLYSKVLTTLIPYLTMKYPMLETDNPTAYGKAIKAKAFDIARSILPAGCTTFVGWHTNLRQAWDHLKELSFHPLHEVRVIASTTLANLKEKYPNSFNFKSYPEQDAFLQECSETTYFEPGLITLLYEWMEFVAFECSTDIAQERMSDKAVELLSMRPEKTELPDWFNKYGKFNFLFLLDFGSFRDLQRHRSCTQLMPLLTTTCGFNKWYLESMPDELKVEVEQVLKTQEKRIAKISDPLIRQYYIAMGYNVFCNVTAGLPSAVYIAELRSGQAVHPTLRKVAQKMGAFISNCVPQMALHCDNSEDEWSTIRGKHDIVKKEF